MRHRCPHCGGEFEAAAGTGTTEVLDEQNYRTGVRAYMDRMRPAMLRGIALNRQAADTGEQGAQAVQAVAENFAEFSAPDKDEPAVTAPDPCNSPRAVDLSNRPHYTVTGGR